MARITVEDCLAHIPNRFDLVLVASKRARQLSHGKEASLPWDNDKPTVMSLREIAGGYVDGSILNQITPEEQADEDLDEHAIREKLRQELQMEVQQDLEQEQESMQSSAPDDMEHEEEKPRDGQEPG